MRVDTYLDLCPVAPDPVWSDRVTLRDRAHYYSPLVVGRRVDT